MRAAGGGLRSASCDVRSNVIALRRAGEARIAERQIGTVERQRGASPRLAERRIISRDHRSHLHHGFRVTPLPFPPLLVQPDPSVWSPGEIAGAAIRLGTGLAIAWIVYRLARRVPWPSPFRLRFAALHLVGAPLAALAWFAASRLLGLFAPGEPEAGGGEFFVVGTIFYAIIVGVAHAMEASGRAARAEATAAQAQLAAMRAQLHPHFLFNALHTVVQLIPVDPARASEAAELVAELLRTTLEEQRDEVTLADEWRFVSRYLAIERIRFGDRLVVRAAMPDELLGERVPAFALQTLVENAVRHGAAPRVTPTEITVAAAIRGGELALSVRNSGDRGEAPARESAASSSASPGTGLARLRERLAALHGRTARLAAGPVDDGGFLAEIVLPRRARSAA